MSQQVIERRVFYKGDVILNEGQSGGEMFIVESGSVEIWKGAGDTHKTLGYIEPGGVFGEMALIDDKPRMANATCAEDAVCKVIDKKMFTQNMKTVDPFMRTVIEILTKNVRSLSTRIDSM